MEDQTKKSTRNRQREVANKALRLTVAAKQKRAVADSMGAFDPTGAHFERREADEAETTAAHLLAIVQEGEKGTGGELVPHHAFGSCVPDIKDTTERPDLVTAEASIQRLELAANADALSLAADAAESIQARNSLEKMLAHQAATAHKLAMTFAATAEKWLAKGDPDLGVNPGKVTAMQEAQRSANAAARMMQAFQQGMATLARIRSGGEQKVTVVHQHVQVAGGQVAVTGSFSKGGFDNGGQ